MNLHDENNLLKDEILTLQNMVFKLTNRVEELEKCAKESNILISYYEEQFKLSQKKKYGISSEKSAYDQLSIASMDRLKDIEYTASNALLSSELVEVHHRKKKRPRVESFPKDIAVEEVVCELSESEQSCPDCGSEMVNIGNECREELVVIPAKTMLRRYMARTYACAYEECGSLPERTHIKKAQWPNPVIKGSFASPESIAYTAHQKFAMGVPLYRQEQEWKRQGVLLSRQTMANWLIRSSNDWLEPILVELKRRLLKCKVAHADETSLQVLREAGKSPQSKGYLWCYRTSGDATEPIVLAEYIPDRKHRNPAIFLEGYNGYLHTDGYDAYHKLPKEIIVVGCWAHVRRKWDDALKTVGIKYRENSTAMIGKRYCDKLFTVEREISEFDATQRYVARLKNLKPLMDEFFAWLADAEILVLPKSLTGKAIAYMSSQQQYLKNVLLDGRLELSNNRAERTIKPFVISRKNFLFANTTAGANATATFFSLVETAKETGVNPYEYLTYVFKTAPNVDMNDPVNIEALLPHSYKNLRYS